MDILGLDKLKRVNLDVNFSDFRKIKSLKLHHEEKIPSIELIICTDQFNPNIEMRIIFRSVSKLKIDGLGDSETRVDGFDVIDIKNKGWDGIYWEVIDFEEDSLHFYAKNVEIADVKEAAA
jgi:hypothetical protein